MSFCWGFDIFYLLFQTQNSHVVYFWPKAHSHQFFIGRHFLWIKSPAISFSSACLSFWRTNMFRKQTDGHRKGAYNAAHSKARPPINNYYRPFCRRRPHRCRQTADRQTQEFSRRPKMFLYLTTQAIMNSIVCSAVCSGLAGGYVWTEKKFKTSSHFVCVLFRTQPLTSNRFSKTSFTRYLVFTS